MGRQIKHGHTVPEKRLPVSPQTSHAAPSDQQAPSWLEGPKHNMMPSTHKRHPASGCTFECSAGSHLAHTEQAHGKRVGSACTAVQGGTPDHLLVQVDVPPGACIDAGGSTRAGSGGAVSCNIGTAKRSCRQMPLIGHTDAARLAQSDAQPDDGSQHGTSPAKLPRESDAFDGVLTRMQAAIKPQHPAPTWILAQTKRSADCPTNTERCCRRQGCRCQGKKQNKEPLRGKPRTCLLFCCRRNRPHMPPPTVLHVVWRLSRP